MAGDLKIYEQAVVLKDGAPESGARSAARSAVEQASGGVTHQYGQRVIIAAVPPTATQSFQQRTFAAVTGESASVPDAARSGLSEEEILGLDAFSLRLSPEYKEAKAQRPLDDQPWDTDEASHPDAHNEEAESFAAEARSGAEAQAPTSSRLTGKVAVGIIIVEGPTADLKFSAAERTKVVAEVQNGLSWLGSQSSPGGISWFYDIRVVTLTTRPGPAGETLEQKENRWRNPAMAQLGFGSGMAGVQAYVEQLRTSKGTNWAYCGFFTKYPLGHFAYASIGGPRLVMAYSNDGWGPDNIDRVFAHETGHIFNAPDEYAASGCNCGGSWGAFGKPNANCENCAPSGGVPCIMKGNTWEMCAHTPFHLGFPQGQRYSGVFQAATGSYGLWVNADWNHFVAKWNEWNGQGMRLEDIEISQPGGQLRYSGVFRQGSGGYGLWALADWNSFVAKWNQWNGQGLRLVDLEISQVGNDLRYSGVFQAGSGGHGLWVNADWNGFVAKWQEWSNQGLRLVDFTAIQVGGQMRYSGVFRQGSGGYGLWALADWNSFIAKWNEWNGQGLRLVDLEITKMGNDTRYSGVFRQGSGGYGLWVNTDWSSFVNKWQEWSGQGLRLIDFDITLTGIEAAASPVAPAATAGAAGDETGAEGYGFLSFDNNTGDDQDSGAGFGAVSLSGSAASSSGDQSAGGAGFGAVSFTGTKTGDNQSDDSSGAGFGAVSLSGSAASGDQAGGAGFGAVSLPKTTADGDEESGSGFGRVVLGN